MPALIQIDEIGGRVVIEDVDGKRYAYDPEEGLRHWQNVHTGMFLQPAMARQLGTPIRTFTTDEKHPFPKLVEKVQSTYEVNRAIRCVIDSIAADRTVHEQRAWETIANQLLIDDGVFAQVQEALLSRQPVGFDITTIREGRVGEIVTAIREKYSQPHG